MIRHTSDVTTYTQKDVFQEAETNQVMKAFLRVRYGQLLAISQFARKSI